MMDPTIREILDRWRELRGASTGAIGAYLDTGDRGHLDRIGSPSTYSHWLYEDLVRALPDPPRFREIDLRILSALEAAGRRPGHPAGQDPVRVLLNWFGGILAREPDGEDWLSILRRTVDVPPLDLAMSASWWPLSIRDRTTSAGRYFLGLTVDELLPALSLARNYYADPATPMLRFIAKHQPERTRRIADALWPTVPPYGKVPFARFLFEVGSAECVQKVIDEKVDLGRSTPGADAHAGHRRVIADHLRYRRIDAASAAAIEAHLDGVGTLDGVALQGCAEVRDLAAWLPPPSRLEDVDRRAIDVLLRAGQQVALIGWIDASLRTEIPGEDLTAAAIREIAARGADPAAIAALIDEHATRYRNAYGGLTSLGRRLLARSDDELVAFVEAQLGHRAHATGLAFLGAESPDRVERILGGVVIAGSWQGHRLREFGKQLLATHGARFEAFFLDLARHPERCFSAADLAQPYTKAHVTSARVDLWKALAQHDRRFVPEAARVIREALDQPKSYAAAELRQWLVRTLGREALAELLDAPADPDLSVESHKVALLIGAFGSLAAAVAVRMLDRPEGYWRLFAVGYLIGLGDAAFDDRIGKELDRCFSEPDHRTVISAIGHLERWGLSRMSDRVWSLLESKSKQVRVAASRAIRRHEPEVFDRAARLAIHRRADARHGAVLVLKGLDDPRVPALLEARAEVEPSEDVRDDVFRALESIWAKTGRVITFEEIERRAARTKVEEGFAGWLDEAKLPLPSLSDGSPMTRELLRYLLYRQSRVRGMRPDVEARPLYDMVDRGTSGDLAAGVLDAFLSTDQEADDGWAMAFAGLLGDERVVPKLVSSVDRWVKAKRLAFAEYGVEALALQGGEAALLALDALALRYATKPRNVGEAAENAFAEAAERTNVSLDELRDRVIPWLGFTPNEPRIISAGGRAIEVRIGMDLKVAFRDAKTKKKAAVPKSVPPDVKGEIAELKSVLAEAAKAQVLRLENLLVAQHRWPVDRWKERFLEHPLLFPLAVRLVWGAYDASDRLTTTFRALEDRTLTSVDDGAVDLAGVDRIGLVHPMDLGDATPWKQHLADHHVESPFPQLERQVVRLRSEQEDMTAYCDFAGVDVDARALKRGTARMSWRRGDTDHATIDSYWKPFPLAKIIARIHVDEMYVVLDMSRPSLGDLVFARSDRPYERMRLSEVPALVLSESVSDLQRITGRAPSPRV
jgi:hypothetical protein